MSVLPQHAPDAEGDLKLVSKIRAGDEGALGELFRKYYPGLISFASAMVHAPDVAEEFVQDVFFTIWNNRESWRVEQGNVRNYLYRAARNHALNYLRRRKVELRWQEQSAREFYLPDAMHQFNTAESRLRARDIDTAVQRALATLPPRQREAYALRWQHELSYADIAHVMGIAEATVQIHITKAVAMVRSVVEEFLSKEEG